MTDRSDTDPQRLTDQISAAMIHNAGLFLKKAAEEIAAHVDGPNAAFDIDRATQVTVLMQIAVELSATAIVRSEEHTSELQSLMRISYAVFCFQKNTKRTITRLNSIHNSYI